MRSHKPPYAVESQVNELSIPIIIIFKEGTIKIKHDVQDNKPQKNHHYGCSHPWVEMIGGTDKTSNKYIFHHLARCKCDGK